MAYISVCLLKHLARNGIQTVLPCLTSVKNFLHWLLSVYGHIFKVAAVFWETVKPFFAGGIAGRSGLWGSGY